MAPRNTSSYGLMEGLQPDMTNAESASSEAAVQGVFVSLFRQKQSEVVHSFPSSSGEYFRCMCVSYLVLLFYKYIFVYLDTIITTYYYSFLYI